VSLIAREILTRHARDEWVEGSDVSEAHSAGYIWGRIRARDTERKMEKEV
jgi:hypothetical protein